MLIIRLQRVGKLKKPTYRLIISEKSRSTCGTYLESLGSFNPHDKEKGLVLKTDRIKYWLEKGAQVSNTVHNILLKQGLAKGEKRKSVSITNARRKKMEEKAKANAKETAPAAPTSPAAPAA